METSKATLVVSVAEAGRLLGICRDSAYAAVRRGTLPSIRIGRRIVVSKVVIERMLGGETISGPVALSDDTTSQHTGFLDVESPHTVNGPGSPPSPRRRGR